jgi:hypothetical protein
MNLMRWVIERLEGLGGIASRSELAARGVDRDPLDICVYYGRVRRIRKGWYATLDVDPEALEAWRIGGRLACVSALEHHGLALPVGDGSIHIEVPRGTSRLRDSAREVVVHWTRHPQGGDRLAVAPEAAVLQAAACEGPRRGAGAGGESATGSREHARGRDSAEEARAGIGGANRG